MNVPDSIATAISSGLVSMVDLQTKLGLEDLYLILEVANVNAHNAHALRRHLERENR